MRSLFSRLYPAASLVILTGGFVILFPAPARAATLCVNLAGSGGCTSTINAAVANASAGDVIQVAKGIYSEDVKIDKTLSLVGADPKTTIIDATGLSNGIYIDGLDNVGLVDGTLVKGFTIRNANFEGILITNASSVTIAGNIATGNDKSLDETTAPSTCPGVPSFETNEGFDCGEAIHLSGTDHALVSDNVVQNNAGGILISDDTAAVHDNVIEGNTVKNNAFDCGITLASHAPATGVTPFGVFNNTIANNISSGNGLGLQGEGAGVGIFDSIPNTNNSGNVVIHNTLTNNGLPGVAMHSHTASQTMNDNKIIGNTISGNGADTTNGASQPTGINLAGVSPAAGTIISGNTIKNEALDIVINTAARADIHLNNLLGKGVGVQSSGTGTTDASDNYWGCAGGPSAKGCSSIDNSGGGSLVTGASAAKPF